MYTVEYIRCRVCGQDNPRWRGVRGNQEHAGILAGETVQEHRVTNIVQCRQCGFIYTNPLILNVLGPEAGYGHPPSYAASSSVEPEVLFNATLDWIQKWRRPPGYLIDVGCGKGEFLNAACRKGWDVTGIERSKPMADCAQKTAGTKVLYGNLEEMGLGDGIFDVATLHMVLEHVDQPHPLLAEVVRLLKDRGLLFIEVPNMDSFMLASARWYFRFRGLDWSPLLSPLQPPFHCYGYNRRSLLSLVRPHGLVLKASLVTDTRLRGFKEEKNYPFYEKTGRRILTSLGRLLGRGDVLMALFEKRDLLSTSSRSVLAGDCLQKTVPACASSS